MTPDHDQRNGGWRDIASAPRDGTPFIATIQVTTKSGLWWWETHVLYCDDETGEIDVDCEQGWHLSDYEAWQPVPDPPHDNPPPSSKDGML